MAYSDIEPFGEARADLRIGVAAARLAGLIAGDRHRPIDFMPELGQVIEQDDIKSEAPESSGPRKTVGEMRMLIESAVRFAERRKAQSQ